MSIRNYTFTFLVLIWIATGGAQTIQTSNTTEAISINDPRPVAKALEVLEERHGLAVNYEDPEYTHSSNTQDVTAAVRKPLTGTTGQRVIIPRGGSLLFQYIVNNNQPLESTTALLGRLLTEHASRGGAEFDLRQRQTKNGIKLDVVPNRVKNAAGEFVENTPLLDYRITVPKQERSGMGVLSAICQELTQLSSHHVVAGIVPANPLLNYREEFQAVDEPARDAVTRLLSNIEGASDMVWQLFYDPGMDWYVLNIHIAHVGRQQNPGSNPHPSHPARLSSPILFARMLAPKSISEVQLALAAAGYYRGEPNGKWDANTVSAMREFQSANNLPPSGRPDSLSLQKLGVSPVPAASNAPSTH